VTVPERGEMGTTGIPRVAIIGLDGATYRVLDRLQADGVMPAFAGVRARGISATLRSTTPSYTPPGWVSMLTGVNPGRHGVIGFLENTPQEPPRIAHSGTIRAPTLWRYLNERGLTAGIFNVPMTYPPVSLNGFMVSGGLGAGWTDPRATGFGSDQDVGTIVGRECGEGYPLDTVVSYENDWSSDAAVGRIEEVQRMRRRVLGALLHARPVDVLFAVFEGPDRLQHLHYQYLVECSDWFARPEASRMRDRAHAYFAELDRAIGDLVDWVGSNGSIVFVSDHGAGPWEKTLNVNLLLRDWGYLEIPAIGRVTRTRMVSGVGQRVARRLIPRGVLLAAKARVTRGITWERTRAFASQVAEQGIHVNERGALPHGVVDPEDVDHVQRTLADQLRELVDPIDGRPVVDRVVERREVIHGPFERRAPHLFPLCRDQRYELSDTLAATSPLTDHRDRPWGYHHVDGIFVAAGTGFGTGTFAEGLDIVDVLPTVFHAMGQGVPEGLDGRVIKGVLSRRALSTPVQEVLSNAAAEGEEDYPFSDQEQREIEESLRGLGYIE
jgi:predicted AlkP superfamily phosphohydrolase/phosphomutase